MARRRRGSFLSKHQGTLRAIAVLLLASSALAACTGPAGLLGGGAALLLSVGLLALTGLGQTGCDDDDTAGDGTVGPCLQPDGDFGVSDVGPCLTTDAYVGPCLQPDNECGVQPDACGLPSDAAEPDAAYPDWAIPDAYVGPCLQPDIDANISPCAPDACIGPCLDIDPDAHVGPCLSPPMPDAWIGPCLSPPMPDAGPDAWIGPCLSMPAPDAGEAPPNPKGWADDEGPIAQLDVCLSVVPDEDLVHPCLSIAPPPPPPPKPDASPSDAGVPEAPKPAPKGIESLAQVHVCLSVMPIEPDPPVEPCLSVAPPPPPTKPDAGPADAGVPEAPKPVAPKSGVKLASAEVVERVLARAKLPADLEARLKRGPRT